MTSIAFLLVFASVAMLTATPVAAQPDWKQLLNPYGWPCPPGYQKAGIRPSETSPCLVIPFNRLSQHELVSKTGAQLEAERERIAANWNAELAKRRQSDEGAKQEAREAERHKQEVERERLEAEKATSEQYAAEVKRRAAEDRRRAAEAGRQAAEAAVEQKRRAAEATAAAKQRAAEENQRGAEEERCTAETIQRIAEEERAERETEARQQKLAPSQKTSLQSLLPQRPAPLAQTVKIDHERFVSDTRENLALLKSNPPPVPGFILRAPHAALPQEYCERIDRSGDDGALR